MDKEKLTTDEFDALEFIRRGANSDRFNACVGRNAKKLSGLKLIQYDKGGRVALTDKGAQLMFVRRCIAGLRALAQDPAASVEPEVIQFLSRKSHIAQGEDGFVVTDKGHEALADIAANEKRS
jgi:hypothetical protein